MPQATKVADLIRRDWLRRYGWALAALVLGLLATIGVVDATRQRLRAQMHQHFEAHADRLTLETSRRLLHSVFGLKGARGMYAAFPEALSAQAFSAYVHSRDLPVEFPGAVGVGFLEPVGLDAAPSYEAAIRGAGEADFELRTDGGRASLWVVRHVEPLAPNRPAWGLDLASDDTRRDAIERAVRTGEPTLTAAIQLEQQPGELAVLVLLPVYHGGVVPATQAEREARVRGLLYAPVVIAQCLKGVVDAAAGQVDFELFDGAEPSSEHLLYDDDGHLRRGDLAPQFAARPFQTKRQLEVGGRQMSVILSSTPAFVAAYDGSGPWRAAAAGLGLTLFLALGVGNLGRGRSSAMHLAQRMTAELESERARLSDVLAGTHAGALRIGLQRDEAWLDGRAAQMLGLADAARGGRSLLLARVHAQDRTRLLRAVRRHLRGQRELVDCELRYRLPDGRWIGLQLRARALPSPAAPEWLTGVVLDVSERRQMAEMWRLQAELSGDWFWTTDKEHRFEGNITNPVQARIAVASEFHGWRRDQVSWIEAPAEGWEAFHARLDRHEPFRGIVYRSRKQADQPWRFVEIDGRPRFDDDGVFLGYFGVGRDVTERERANVELRESLSLVDALVQAIPLPLFLCDAQGRLQRCNPAFSALMAELAADAGGVAQIPALAPKALQEALRLQGAQQPDQAWRSELQASLRGGRRLDAVLSQAALRGAAGETLGLVGAVFDISDQKRTQRALEEAKAAAEAANQAKSAFLAAMSHEIRTPMNGVLGMSELLAHSSLDEDQAQSVRVIRSSARNLLRIIDDILDFSKIEAGRLEFESQPFNLRGLVEGTVEGLGTVAVERQVLLSAEVAPTLPARVLGDPTRWRQVLTNLLGNGLKFSSGLEGRRGRVSVKALAGPLGLRMEVRDNGIGMDAATQARLFQPFMQAEASTTRRFGGTGLGLAITRRLVELMRGRLTVQSEPGQGSCFTVDLPLSVSQGQVRVDAPRFESWVCEVMDADGLPLELLRTWLRRAAVGVELRTEWPTEPVNPPRLLITTEEKGPLPSGWHLICVGAAGPESGAVRLSALTETGLLKAVAQWVDADRDPADPGRHEGERSPLRPTARLALPGAPLPPAAILVAEDDAINRRVISKQLSLLGLTADIAHDGQQALKLWRAGAYPLLLTDLHMPNLDGYDLVKAIRAEEAAGLRPRMPILALTANALKGEEQRAMALGFDDYLTKPISLDALAQALRRWMAMSAPVGLSAEPLLDLRVLLKLIGGDEAMRDELLGEFARNVPALAADLLRALRASDAPSAAAQAHKLKSAARAVGALQLAAQCERIEVSKTSEAQDLTRLLAEQFERVYADTLSRVQDALKRGSQ